MAPPVDADPASLNVLTETLNQTLIETGRFFRSGASASSKVQLKRSIPMAQEKFQSALDELSEQIFIAKAFLERDYDALQAKKASLKPTTDVVMGGSDVKQEPESQPHPEQPADMSPAMAMPAEQAANTNPPQTNGDSVQKSSDQEVKPEQVDDTSILANQSLPTASDLNFNTAPNNPEGPNDFDLNLDFGDDNIGNENFLSGSNFGSLHEGGHNEPDKTNIPPANTSPNTQGDAGQNTNIQTGGDAFDLELQKAGVFTEQQPEAQTNNTGNNEDTMALGQSSFDELFMESENFGGEGMGDPNLLEGDGLMNINELDDSWFT
ncbi:hypothetical protein BDV59DRAFT_205834 [Aspergillus ambiguus]|uniref:uncharacterized protein n=1 Tax=Aspergillus ambiguus TaxID=176160 RepID=UPI003CCCE2AE